VTAVEVPLLRRQAYVDGEWVDAGSGETFPVVSYGIDEWLELKYWAIGGISGP
jgi:hypothetical protein